MRTKYYVGYKDGGMIYSGSDKQKAIKEYHSGIFSNTIFRITPKGEWVNIEKDIPEKYSD